MELEGKYFFYFDCLLDRVYINSQSVRCKACFIIGDTEIIVCSGGKLCYCSLLTIHAINIK